jgi:signal peptidase II
MAVLDRLVGPAMRPVARVALATLVIDQLSKYVVVHLLRLGNKGAIDVLPPWLQFRMAWNEGINFGLFSAPDSAMRLGLIVLACGISVWIWLWMRKGGQGPRARIAAGLLIGGALGNVIDRLAYGAVADFLNMGFPGFRNPYSFNVADVAIFAGAVGLALYTGDGPATGKGRGKARAGRR